MSSLNVIPEIVTAASGNLQNLGCALRTANAAAAGQTTAIAAPAADEVSSAISTLFSAHAEEFQALSAKAAAFHDGFVNLLSGGAAQYVSAEVGNAQQVLVNAVSMPAEAVLGRSLIGTGQTITASAAANPAAFWQTVTNLVGGHLVGKVGDVIWKGAVKLESSVSGLAPLSTSLAIGGAGVGTEIGQFVGGAIGSLIGPEGTIIGVLVGGDIGGTLGGLAGELGPGFIIGEVINRATGWGDAIGSEIYGAGQAIGSDIGSLFGGYTNVDSLLTDSPIGQLVNDADSSANNLAINIESLSGDITSGSLLNEVSNWPTQLSNFQLGPNLTLTSDVVSPYGYDGIQQDVTGVYTFGAGPFSVQWGSFQGNVAADLYGGHAIATSTILGFSETGGVYETPGGTPHFFFSGSVPVFGLGVLSTPQLGF